MQSTTATSGQGPGKMLAAARERMGISLDKVASKLNLSPQYIAALENEQYERLAGPTYVKGYLRAYAILVNVPVNTVLEAYGLQNRAPAAKESALAVPRAREEKNGLDENFKLVSVVVAVVIVGLVIAWWQGRNGDAIEEPAGAETALPAPENPPQMSGVGGMQAEAPMMSPVLPAPAEQDAQIKQDGRAQDEAAMAETKAVPETGAKTQTAAPADAVPRMQPQRTAPPAPVSARVRIVLRTTAASWIDIRDAYQNRLLYENVDAGREIPIEAMAPLQVFIGNPDGVELSYNGKPFDLSRYRQGLVARFTLKPEAGSSGQ